MHTNPVSATNPIIPFSPPVAGAPTSSLDLYKMIGGMKIDMVQQQGGAAEKVDYLGENILVAGMLFDDFAAGDTLTIAPADAAG